jgi:glutamate-ammonia-ligase adenylyltransferase
MRARLLRDLPPAGPWDVKLRAGGQIEVEFIAQILTLLNPTVAATDGGTSTRVMLERLLAMGALPEADAGELIRADRVWRTVQGLLRITSGRTPPARLSGAAAAALLAAAGTAGAPAVDADALHATLEELARAVRALFIRHVGEILL